MTGIWTGFWAASEGGQLKIRVILIGSMSSSPFCSLSPSRHGLDARGVCALRRRDVHHDRHLDGLLGSS
jgi:hypothetical protein